MTRGLYYPFSRCINAAALKQLLLVFDQVAFLDPVDDEDWRAWLLQEEEADEPRFKAYQPLSSAIRLLVQERAVVHVNPRTVASIHTSTTAAAAASDLLDPVWTRIASKPSDYLLPFSTSPDGSGASWQTFPEKLPRDFAAMLLRDEKLLPHVMERGRGDSSWRLSYAAGSAAALNSHLAAAAELGMAPVTDSKMHHQLLLRKVLRASSQDMSSAHDKTIPPAAYTTIAADVTATIFRNLVPEQALARADFDEILTFRDKTRPLRQAFNQHLESAISAHADDPNADIRTTHQSLTTSLKTQISDYESATLDVRNKIWPSLLTSIATVGPAALAMSFTGAPLTALAASILAPSILMMKDLLDIKMEKHKADRSAGPVVSYVSTVRADLA